MSAIVIDRQIVHYEVLGRGRPLIFLHGWVGSWRYWIPAMQALSSEYRTYALDFWGFGDTARNSEGYSLSGQAELIFKFMDQLGIIRAAFVGHSLGGVAGLDFAIRHADYADRLMLVSTPLFGAALNPRFVNAETGALTEWLLGREPGMEQVSSEAAKADLPAIQATVHALQELDLRPNFSLLNQAPCLLVQGERDPAVALPQDSWMTGVGGNLHRITFEDSRHFPMLDQTARFNRLLADFLSLKSGEQVSDLQLKEEWRRRVR